MKEGGRRRLRPRNTRPGLQCWGWAEPGEGLLSQPVSRGACAAQPRVLITLQLRWDLLLFIFIGRQWNDIIIKSRLFSWTALYVSVINHKLVIKIKILPPLQFSFINMSRIYFIQLTRINDISKADVFLFSCVPHYIKHTLWVWTQTSTNRHQPFQ